MNNVFSKISSNNYSSRETSMPFPETKRIIYEKNPLTKVICQFRFPPILKIDSEVPSIFQEKIRGTFPLYIEKNELTPQFSPSISPDVVRQFMVKSSVGKNHEFSTEDQVLKVNLTKTFISLSTSKYQRWELFSGMLVDIIQALLDIYRPPFFTRIGLRYVDIFNRSLLGLNDVNWDELINPQFLGLLSAPFRQNIQNCESVYEIKLADESSIVRIATSFVQELKTNERCYMVDSDFYNSQRITTQESYDKLDFLHQRATRLIHFIIKEKLHNAMEPKDL